MMILRSQRLVLSDSVGPGTLHIRDGVFEKIGAADEVPSGAAVVDVGNLAVMPGLVDTHVHFNEPGRTEWEGFETGTRAAAAGGITTIVDMPLNSIPPTVNASALHEKARHASGHCWVDYGFWGGLIPGNVHQIEELLTEGALGCKAFLIDSGVPEFPPADETALRASLPLLKKARAPLLVHAELEGPAPAPKGRSYRDFLASRPREWENRAVRWMIELARKHETRIHIVHLSSSDVLEDLRKAKAQGVPISAETCPHYLTFTSEEIIDGATAFKCAPPIRERENREALWKGLKEGIIDFVVSDHSPCAPGLKCLVKGDFAEAWGGIASLQFLLGAVWTEARRRQCDLKQISQWLSTGPARFAGLSRKGAIEPGYDADLVVWDPDAESEVRPEDIRCRHPVTPYHGRQLKGRVEMTFVRGQLVYDHGTIHKVPHGKWVKANAAD